MGYTIHRSWKMMSYCKYLANNNCPQCGRPFEDTTHVLWCQRSHKQWDPGIEKIITWIERTEGTESHLLCFRYSMQMAKTPSRQHQLYLGNSLWYYWWYPHYSRTNATLSSLHITQKNEQQCTYTPCLYYWITFCTSIWQLQMDRTSLTHPLSKNKTNTFLTSWRSGLSC